jgi:hypothetical protein
MIEVAPVEYWKSHSADDAKLYCFSLLIDGKSGWRLPTRTEIAKCYDRRRVVFLEGWYRVTYRNSYDAVAIDNGKEIIYSWGIDRSWFGDNMNFITMPVRDLKDD